MIKLLSTNCKCSKCMDKYDCEDYKKIVLAQRVAKAICDSSNNIVLRFQTEFCPNLKVEEIKI